MFAILLKFVFEITAKIKSVPTANLNQFTSSLAITRPLSRNLSKKAPFEYIKSLKELKDQYRDPISHADETMEYSEMDVDKIRVLLYEIQTRTTKFYGK